MTATGAPDVFAVDELRALARLAGTALPGSLDGGWDEEDEPVADVVAVRALLARGALALHAGAAPALVPTAAVADRLGPLLRPSAVVEFARIDGHGRERRAVVVGGRGAPGVALHLAEREPDVWAVATVPGTVEQVALDLLLDDLGADDPGAVGPVAVAEPVGQPPGAPEIRVALARHEGGEVYATGALTWSGDAVAGYRLVDPDEDADAPVGVGFDLDAADDDAADDTTDDDAADLDGADRDATDRHATRPDPLRMDADAVRAAVTALLAPVPLGATA